MKKNSYNSLSVLISFLMLSVFLFFFSVEKIMAKAVNSSESVEILDYELIQIQSANKAANKNQTSSDLIVSFDGLGQRFDLHLQQNQALLENLPQTQLKHLTSSITPYRGYIEGIKDSWVRLSRQGPLWWGMIWDGYEMYVVDSSEEIFDALKNLETSDEADTVIFRLADTIRPNTFDYVLKPGSNSFLKATPETHIDWHNYEHLVDHLREMIEQGNGNNEEHENNSGQDNTDDIPEPALKLDIAIIADTQFIAAESNPEQKIISNMNVVDGIFSEQLDIGINISDIHLLTDNGPITSTDALTLINQLRDYVNTQHNNPGLVHLLTGREMDGGVAGLAYQGVLCDQTYGVGFSQAVSVGSLAAFIIAHELGHNFGAPHDYQTGSQCASESDQYLMNPYITGTDQFSQCSIDKMQAHIETVSCLHEVANKNSTLTTLLPANKMMAYSRRYQPNPPDADASIHLAEHAGIYKVDKVFELLINIMNQSTAIAYDVVTVVNVPADFLIETISSDIGSCSLLPGQARCRLGQIAGDEVRHIRLTMRGRSRGDFTITAAVEAANDGDDLNDQLNTAVKIL